MKDSTRRLVLFLVITTGGSVLILFDIPPLLFIAGTVIFAILVIFLTGAVTPAEVRGAFKKKPKKAPKAKGPARKAGRPAREKGAGGVLSRMHQGFSLLAKNLKGSLSAGPPTQGAGASRVVKKAPGRAATGGISSLLDLTPEVAPLSRKTEPDPFLSIGNEPLDTDLLSIILPEDDRPLLDDLDPLADNPAGPSPVANLSAVEKMEISLNSEEEEINIDEETDDEVKEILEAHKSDLLDEDGMPTPEDLGGALPDFGEVNIGSLDIDGIIPGEPENSVTTPGPGPGTAQMPASGKAPQGATGGTVTGGGGLGGGMMPDLPQAPREEAMLDFAAASQGGDDDLMAALKSEAKGTKKKENLSLLRDLKDTRVSANDLEKEILSLLGGSKSNGSPEESE